MKKKGIALFLMILLALVCAGCGSTPAQTASAPVPAETPEQTSAEPPSPVQETENMPQAEAAGAPVKLWVNRQGQGLFTPPRA